MGDESTCGGGLPQTYTHCVRFVLVDMTDNLGFGKQKRRDGNLEILSGRVTFR